MAEKKCTKCGALKLISEFYFRPDRGKHASCCKKCHNKRTGAWFKKNPEAQVRYNAERLKKDPDGTRATWREMKRRQRADPVRRFIGVIRTNVYLSLKNSRKHEPTFALLGYSREELISHIERQFSSGMKWSNYGEWHIDHIIPLSAFNISSADSADFRAAWSLPNLRPMWGVENMKKGARMHLLI